MKLIFCPSCHDLFRLINEMRTCKCGLTKGRYTDELNAEISGLAIPIGIHNPSFIKAILNRPDTGMGERFEAFIIPKEVKTIKVNKSLIHKSRGKKRRL